MTRHLVTGGAGFLGSALVRRLLDRGDAVTVLDRMSRGKEERVPEGAELIAADIRDPISAGLDCDCIWHLAYIQGTQNFYAEPAEVIDVALLGIMNVLDHAEWAEADLVLVSSSEVYQEPGVYPTPEDVPLVVPDVTNPRYSYGAGKIASEVAALAHAEDSRRTMIVRPHNVIGPDMGEEHVVPQLARRVQGLSNGRLSIQGDGTATRCFCHVDDAVSGLLAVYDRGANREVYHLGDPRVEVAIGDLARDIVEFYGVDAEVVPSELPKGSPTRRVPDVSKLQALGWAPEIDYSAMMIETLGWYRDE